MIRFHTLTGMDDLGPVMLMVASITMLVGVLGALAQSDVKRILSFHVISQIGYMMMGMSLFTVAGTAGAILFLIHHMPVKAVLFLVGGLIENHEGSSSLDRSGGLAGRQPLVAVMFAVPALSLAGIPPFSGFVAKLAVVSAAIDRGGTVAVVAALVAGGLTLLSMAKIWNEVFWGRRDDEPRPRSASRGGTRVMHAATALAVVGTLLVSLFAGTLLDLSTEAAENLRNADAYIAAVRS